jgi:hypothetical protein
MELQCATARKPNLPMAKFRKRALPRKEAVAPVNRIVPRPRATICSPAFCATRKPPKAPLRQQRSNSLGSISNTLPGA